MTGSRQTPRSDDELSSKDVVEALDTLRKLLRQYGLVGLALLGMGGGTAILTIPNRLSKVEQDHTRMLAHISKMEEGQNWMLCVVDERNRINGDVHNCDGIKPRRFRAAEDTL